METDSGWSLLLKYSPLSMMEMQIVEVSGTDLKKLQEISRSTFIQSYVELNTAENMQLYLNQHFSKEKLTEELKNLESKFFFAVYGAEVVGYLKLNWGSAQTELPKDEGLEIERIYVLPALKGKGIGQLFISKAFELARKSQANYVWLAVWEKNAPAIRFYEKCGFKKFSQHIFKLGLDDQTDHLMKKMI
jgi:ribosomal protein S18 acetylase RimI-like enzyme